ncbi:DoxX family protein [Paractinoplanes atraurantiacus]|uniref:Methylamine utilisation protein MauE n=1 Tax=Paractinoplanes atraurantiacus TaxID=1036182 RepID=A0A285H1Q8_9ACTN|nr:MauE/DoxX family redox-associated membrane protein [Actinoplanes atraurantiacus]SNY29820.1 Methylamine utilisation protein MauE [Actinoplanes atraurantiacus]
MDLKQQQSTRLTAAWPWISTLARLGLAAVFLISGGLKVTDLAASGRAVNAYDLMSWETAKVVGAVQPFLEIAVGLLLLIGIATRLSAAIAAVLLVIFIGGIISAWARGLQIDCGCFSKGGELTGGRTAEYGLDILRDVGFLVLAGILLWKPRSKFSVDGLLLGER